MAQTKVLLDTNSYLRLAFNLHPLLFVPFGDEAYTLYVHPDLRAECDREPRLRNKFDWVRLPKFEENRKRPLQLSNAQKKAIAENFDFMWGHVAAEGLSPSPVDTRILATALELEIHVVTDDRGMIDLAKEYGVPTWTTLELMKQMFDADHLSIEKVRMLVAQWIYDEDLPARELRTPYRDFFGEDPPTGFA
ncbi:hypothetical protein OKA04_18405 [Luteolibacter flavescens]|uniref:DNA-binding protein n=1 Tax=Luteolibacter flavescens TaxID=1859460 RepID=A0ABT3FTC8_9BACT|nr:hypothetical protein [Luteolibacter flavescens]MCW1886717.1 hypothetical protein [Luteolibacter flavescens]